MAVQYEFPDAGGMETPPEIAGSDLLQHIILQPVQALTYLQYHPQQTWFVPVVLAILLVIAQALVTVPVASGAATQQLQKQLAQVPAEERAQIEQRLAQGNNMVLSAGTAIVTGLIGLWLHWLLRTGVIHLVARRMGGRHNLNQVFGVVVWTWIPQLLRGLLRTLSIAFSGTLTAHQGLSAYVAALGQRLPIGTYYALLSSAELDLFVLWSLMLLALGVLIVTELPRAKALIVTAAYWGVATALTLASTIIGQLFSSRF